MRHWIALLGLALLAAGTATAGSAAGAERKLLLATTTSVQDSGLLDALLPGFEKRTGIDVQVVAVGTGAALRMGADGNADVLLTHAPEAEKKLVESGAAVSRIPFMENYFVLVGPPGDPAGVRAADSPEEALRRIAKLPAPYVSRGDDSGTHKREVALLKGAGLDPAGGWPGFMKTGSGMGLTLQVAGEKKAYALSDIGTFLAFQKRIGLDSLTKPSPSLRNVYSVLRVDPERFPGIRAADAILFQSWLLEPATQELIGAYGVARFGQPLFTPLHPEVPAAP